MNHVNGSTNQRYLQQIVDQRQVEPGHDAARIGAREHRRDDGGGHPVARAHAAGEILGQAEQHHRNRRQRQRQRHGAMWPRPNARNTASVAAQAMTMTMPPRREVGMTCSFCTPWGSSWPIARARIASGIRMPAQAAETTKGHQSIKFAPSEGRVGSGRARHLRPRRHGLPRIESENAFVRRCANPEQSCSDPAHSSRPHVWPRTASDSSAFTARRLGSSPAMVVALRRCRTAQVME